MASSSSFAPFMPKLRLSASDFKPFSAGFKPKRADVDLCLSENRKSDWNRAGARHDLNLFSFCPELVDIDAVDSSSSSSDEDESDDEDDDDDVTSKRSSNDTGRTSGSGNSKGSKNSNDSKRKDSDSDVQCSIVRKTVPDNSREEDKFQGRGDLQRTLSSMTKAQVLSKVRHELFSIPGDVPKKTCQDREMSDEENIIEAACGQVSSVGKSEEKSRKILTPSPKKMTYKQLDDSSKSRMVNCPVCGKVIIEKSAKLSDHYKICHTPQRTDLDCLGFIPTHRLTDGTAIVRLNDSQRLSGHQCFICYRICRNSRELNLHWQLHKVYVDVTESRLAADDMDLNTSNENLELVTDTSQTFVEPSSDTENILNSSLDFSEPEDNEYWTSDAGMSTDEDEGEIEALRYEFKQKAILSAERVVCAGEFTDTRGESSPVNTRKKRRKKKSKETSSDTTLESLMEKDFPRRCPGCDIVFKDEVTCSQHRVRDHDTKLMYRCVREDCRQVFHHHKAYREHHRCSHRQRAFVCSVCNDHFSVYGQLMAHRRRDHRFLLSQRPNFPCPVCQTSFPDEEMLTAHTNSAIAIRQSFVKLDPDLKLDNQLRCLICMTVFDNPIAFSLHIDEHFNHTYICPALNCKVVCSNLVKFRIHFREHCYNNALLSCPRCRKVFADCTAKKRHMKRCVHLCRVCNKKSFLFDEEFLIHFYKVHHWLTVVCQFCCEIIPSLKDAVQHQKRYHLNMHAVGSSSLEPRVCVGTFDQTNSKFFPNLLAKFPDLGNGCFGFVSMGSHFFPSWWKLSADERSKKRSKRQVKTELEDESKCPVPSDTKPVELIDELVSNVENPSNDHSRDDLQNTGDDLEALQTRPSKKRRLSTKSKSNVKVSEKEVKGKDEKKSKSKRGRKQANPRKLKVKVPSFRKVKAHEN